MFRNFHNASGLSIYVGNQLPRWRMVFIALLLVLALGSVSTTPGVQAAPTRELVYFSMQVQNPKTTLRCGQTVTYLVVVEAAPSNGMPTPSPSSLGFPKGMALVKVKVEALSVNKSVGDFVGTATANTAVVFDSELTTGLAAKFKFKANKPGKTTLYFEGLVGKEYVSAKLDVKVLPCKFKVSTIGEWHVPGPGNGTIVAISNDAEMKAAEAQGNFTGSTSVNFAVSYSQVVDCSGFSISGSSQVQWTGQMDDSGRLSINGAYQPVALTVPYYCVGSDGTVLSGSYPLQLTPDPLQVSMASSGGVFRQSQVLQGPEATSGFVTIIVVPDEDEASAFIPQDHQARIGPLFPGWPMQWDELSRLLGALLALH